MFNDLVAGEFCDTRHVDVEPEEYMLGLIQLAEEAGLIGRTGDGVRREGRGTGFQVDPALEE